MERDGVRYPTFHAPDRENDPQSGATGILTEFSSRIIGRTQVSPRNQSVEPIAELSYQHPASDQNRTPSHPTPTMECARRGASAHATLPRRVRTAHYPATV